MGKIKIGICGYGNIGEAVKEVIANFPDMELNAIFTRRNPAELQPHITSNVAVNSFKFIENWKDDIDVMIMCGGSATDLPVQVPEVAKHFNTVDSFDTHAKIPSYYEAVNASAVAAKKTSVISGGWDPGLFSLMRLYANAILPQGGIDGKPYTFWGKDRRGLSQGHSNAVRKIEGVKNAVQYTIPIQEAMDRVRNGENPDLTAREKHLRECFVVPEDGADTAAIEEQIKTMPNYFADYDTIVHFITEEELKNEHSEMAHGGFVIHGCQTGKGHKEIMEFSLKLDSNPEFTASVLLTLARAAYKMNQAGQYGAKTMFDIPPAMLSAMSAEELREQYL
ncbi:MAG: diaminopimelate dehydrogenase [Clostridia bacterium]|nr:diaminopimelate dehydrogenase [Clostridia bacterium]